MSGDLGSPLIRAYVRLERLKRRSSVKRWPRLKAFRDRLIAMMTDLEYDAAINILVADQHRQHMRDVSKSYRHQDKVRQHKRKPRV